MKLRSFILIIVTFYIYSCQSDNPTSEDQNQKEDTEFFDDQSGEAQYSESEIKAIANDGLACLDQNRLWCAFDKLSKSEQYGHWDEEILMTIRSLLRAVCINLIQYQYSNESIDHVFNLFSVGNEMTEKMNAQFDLDDYILQYYLGVHYYGLGQYSKMHKQFDKVEEMNQHITEEESIKNEMINWTRSNIEKIEVSLDTEYISISELFQGQLLSSNDQPLTIDQDQNTPMPEIKKVVRCCSDKVLGDDVSVFWVYTSSGSKISILFFPKLDKWKFKNGWNEIDRGEEYYSSLSDILESCM